MQLKKFLSLMEGRGLWDDVNGGHLPEDLVLTARREEIEWVCCESVYEIVPMQDCEDAGKILLKLSGWTQTSLWIPLTRQFDRDCAGENQTKKQGKIQRAFPASQLFFAMPPREAVKALVSIMMSVSWSNRGKPLKLTHYDISRAHTHSMHDVHTACLQVRTNVNACLWLMMVALYHFVRLKESIFRSAMSHPCWSFPHLSSSPPQHSAQPALRDLLQDNTVHRQPLPQEPLQPLLEQLPNEPLSANAILSENNAKESLSDPEYERSGNLRINTPTFQGTAQRLI